MFVSSDRDAASFDEYHATMNFHALPYPERDAKVQSFNANLDLSVI